MATDDDARIADRPGGYTDQLSMSPVIAYLMNLS